MTDTEHPSQWARKLFHQVHRAYVGEAVTDHQVGVAAAALTIQRAFAERDAEYLTPISYALACIANPDWSNMTADDARLLAQKTFAALKSREAGHG